MFMSSERGDTDMSLTKTIPIGLAWNDADAKNWIKAAKADEAKRQAVLAMTGEELRQTPEWLAWIAGR
jgi:hypothetical protein